jgi:hypothetical protein
VYDNVAIQVLPPQLTLDYTEDFNDGVATLFTGDSTGTWQVSAGRYVGTAGSGSTGMKIVDLGLGHGLQPNSYLELQTTVRTNMIGGVIFDEYATNRFKFAAIDVAAGKVLLGHVDPQRGWTIDTSVSRTLTANTDYTMQLIIKGPTVSVSLNGQFVTSWGFNAPVVDGNFGVLTRNGTSSFDVFRVKTNDPAFASGGSAVAVKAATAAKGAKAPKPSKQSVPKQPAAPAAPALLTEGDMIPLLAEGTKLWTAALAVAPELAGALGNFRFAVAQLPGTTVARTFGTTIYFDLDAAGSGWFVDATPQDSREFTRQADGRLVATRGGLADARMDSLTVAMHELGHVLGFGHDSAENELMAPAIRAGHRKLEASVPADVLDHLLGSSSGLATDELVLKYASPSEPAASSAATQSSFESLIDQVAGDVALETKKAGTASRRAKRNK